MPYYIDITIIGAGLVGLATAYELLKKDPRLRLRIIEKERHPALHQSSRNSGVVHSGIYYKPGSAKAKNCIEGRKTLLQFCDAYGIRYVQLSKLIVATKEEQTIHLRELLHRGVVNGLQGLTIFSSQQMREIEPYVQGVGALHIPDVYVVHFQDIARQLAELLKKSSVELIYGQRVTGLRQEKGEIIITTDEKEFCSRAVINCAGLYSDRLARMEKNGLPYKIIPFRGEYFEVVPEKQHLVKGLIYPVADARMPFLGVHLTRKVDGRVEAGPNAVLALSREGYKKYNANMRDCLDMLGYKGFWKMAGRYWDVGTYEWMRSMIKDLFVRDLQRLVPALQKSDLVPAPSGVRAQMISREGKLFDDFVFERSGNILHVLNAPSPAATACFSIGKTLAQLFFAERPI